MDVPPKRWKVIQFIGVMVTVIGVLELFVTAQYKSPGLIYGAVLVPALGACLAIYARAMARRQDGRK